MKSKILIPIICSIILTGCYPDDNAIFKEFGGQFEGKLPEDPSDPNSPNNPINFPCVDLGLSSGNLWANCNIGAKSPEEMGSTFKYSPYLVSQNWGGSYSSPSPWLQPSKSTYQELIDECEWTKSTLNGIEVYKVIGPNENFIYFPKGSYWTNTASVGYASAMHINGYPHIESGNDRFDEQYMVRAYQKTTVSLNLSATEIIFSADGGIKEIQIDSSFPNFDIKCNYSWIHVSIEGNVIFVKCDNNPDLKERNGKIIVTTGNRSKIISLYQDGTNSNLEISEDFVQFSSKGGNKKINFETSSENVRVEADVEWLTLNINNKVLTISAKSNNTELERTGKVFLIAGNISKQINVSQYAEPIVEISSVSSVYNIAGYDWNITAIATMKTRGGDIESAGILMKKNSRNIAPEIKLGDGSNMSNEIYNGKMTCTWRYVNNEGYYFFRAYIRMTDGEIYYSEISSGYQIQ